MVSADQVIGQKVITGNGDVGTVVSVASPDLLIVRNDQSGKESTYNIRSTGLKFQDPQLEDIRPKEPENKSGLSSKQLDEMQKQQEQQQRQPSPPTATELELGASLLPQYRNLPAEDVRASASLISPYTASFSTELSATGIGYTNLRGEPFIPIASTQKGEAIVSEKDLLASEKEAKKQIAFGEAVRSTEEFLYQDVLPFGGVKRQFLTPEDLFGFGTFSTYLGGRILGRSDKEISQDILGLRKGIATSYVVKGQQKRTDFEIFKEGALGAAPTAITFFALPFAGKAIGTIANVGIIGISAKEAIESPTAINVGGLAFLGGTAGLFGLGGKLVKGLPKVEDIKNLGKFNKEVYIESSNKFFKGDEKLPIDIFIETPSQKSVRRGVQEGKIEPFITSAGEVGYRPTKLRDLGFLPQEKTPKQKAISEQEAQTAFGDIGVDFIGVERAGLAKTFDTEGLSNVGVDFKALPEEINPFGTNRVIKERSFEQQAISQGIGEYIVDIGGNVKFRPFKILEGRSEAQRVASEREVRSIFSRTGGTFIPTVKGLNIEVFTPRGKTTTQRGFDTDVKLPDFLFGEKQKDIKLPDFIFGEPKRPVPLSQRTITLKDIIREPKPSGKEVQIGSGLKQLVKLREPELKPLELKKITGDLFEPTKPRSRLKTRQREELIPELGIKSVFAKTRYDSFSLPFYRQKQQAEIKIDLKLDIFQVSRQKQGLKFDIIPKQRPRTATRSSLTNIFTISATKQAQKQSPVNLQFLDTLGLARTRTLPLGGGDGQNYLGRFGRKTKRTYEYRPSLSGIFLGRTIKKAPKGLLTGVEIRYPLAQKGKKSRGVNFI